MGGSTNQLLAEFLNEADTQYAVPWYRWWTFLPHFILPHSPPPPLSPCPKSCNLELAWMDHGSIRHCQTVLGLARVNGGAPFPLRRLLPLQHHTMVYSMQPTHMAMHSRTCHGQATSEHT